MENFIKIRDLMKIVNENNDKISDTKKDEFAKAVSEDIELYFCLKSKTDMDVETQLRFIGYIEDLISELFVN